MCQMCECYVCGRMPHEDDEYCDGEKILDEEKWYGKAESD